MRRRPTGCRATIARAGRWSRRARSARRPRCRRAELLDAAAALFDAHLYFEVHELLEPAWREAEGPERDALQGLIQVAVGYQHLANRNFAGARALLDEGRQRIEGRTLDGLELDAFGHGVRRSLDRLLQLDWDTVPSFPRQDVNARKETS
jgi:predicted metal-dependent hydrolase